MAQLPGWFAGLIAVTLIGLSVVLGLSLRPPRWLEVSPDCAVRNRYDGKQWRQAETTTVTWTGPCVDGRAQGKGILEWFRDGRLVVRYEGEMSKGRVTGHGELVDSRQVRQRGLFDDGEFKDGVADYPDGRRFEGRWYMRGWNKGVLTAPGRRMDGRWYWGRMTGNGVAEGPEGRYEGAWYKGKPEGKGLFVAANGGRYEGKWRDGKLVEPASAQLPQNLDCLWALNARQFSDGFASVGMAQCSR